jgi:hypothetical protein
VPDRFVRLQIVYLPALDIVEIRQQERNMGMNATDMKDTVISKINKESGSAANANKKFGDAVLEYIVDNMEITYGFFGINPSGATETTSFKASLSGSGTLAVSGTFELFLVALATLIKSSTIISPAIGFTFLPLTFNPVGVILSVKSGLDDPDKALEKLCTDIITSLKSSFPNPTPVSGSHTAFAGATTGMVIV